MVSVYVEKRGLSKYKIMVGGNSSAHFSSTQNSYRMHYAVSTGSRRMI